MNMEILLGVWASGATLVAVGMAWNADKWRKVADRRASTNDRLSLELMNAEARARGVGGRGEHATTTVVPIVSGRDRRSS